MTKFERNKLIESCHNNGKSQTEIGKIFKLSQSAISKILISTRGKETDDFQETRGVKSKLGEIEKNKLSSILKKSPTEYGFFVWNKWSIKSIIQQEFGVSYNKNYIYMIMRSINFSSQKPATKDYRKNEELVSVFKEEKIPEIKKKGLKKNEC
jgi:transposase